MRKIDTSKWGSFVLGGENGLFTIVKGKRLTKANMKNGSINFIGSSAENNGVTCHISNDANKHPGNLITVAYNGSVGEAFYQEKEFVASDDVNVLYPRFEMTKNIALFICPIIRSIGKNYEFIDKWKKEVMEKDSIMLPMTSDGKPDFEYMEQYMKNLEESVNRVLIDLQDAKHVDSGVIDTDKWKEFQITEFFDLSLPKGDLQVKKVEDGDIPLITPSNSNNGLLQKISVASQSTLYKANSLTVDMFGNAYYQEEGFFVTAHGHVNVLIPKMRMNRYIGWFMASMIKNMFSNKYGFADMCTQKVLKKECIKLPVDEDDKPDWIYMENYMKKMELVAHKKLHGLLSENECVQRETVI